MTEDMQSALDNLQQELRRGAIVLCVLSLLNEPRYGYALVERLQVCGMPVEPGTLYPLLRRLEKQGLLQSEWETTGPKPRKYYVMSAGGREAYRLLCGDWTDMQATINDMIQEGKPHEP
jgi:DNA-binding PadR family transcriptional regulator